MATTIKAIPALRDKGACEFVRNAEAVERNCHVFANNNERSFCKMTHAILSKSGMLN